MHLPPLRWLPVCLLPVAGACQTYEPRPLDLPSHEAAWAARTLDGPEVQAFAEALAVDAPGSTVGADDGLDMREASMVALAYNADLRQARAALAVAVANEANAGLWDDPVFEMDVLRIVENVPADPWVIPMAVGFTIPLSGRLDVEKALARTEHRAAASDVLLREWETVSDLRDTWFEWSAAVLQADLSRQVIERIDTTLRVVDRLEQSGQLSRMEARLFRLERATRETDRIKAEARAATLALRLRALMGLRPDAAVTLLPSLAMEQDADVSTDAIATSSPMLALARAEYEVAEEALHLEVRRQYPDLTIGPAFERDQDQSRVGFVMGIPIPILNANRAGIAEAIARREEKRVAFEAQFERVMAAFAEARVAAAAAEATRVEVERTLVPLADAQIADQARMAELGQLSALLTLETVIRGQDIKVRLVEARLEEALAANRVRAIVGPGRRGRARRPRASKPGASEPRASEPGASEPRAQARGVRATTDVTAKDAPARTSHATSPGRAGAARRTAPRWPDWSPLHGLRVLAHAAPTRLALLLLAALFLGGCGKGEAPDESTPPSGAMAHEEPAPTNRIDIPPAVRQNLGITFATVEPRVVADTIRVPGRFELLPTARREYRTPLAGRVSSLARQYQGVEPGALLFQLDSPAWRAMQRDIADTMAAVDVEQSRLDSFPPLMEAHRLHEEGLRESVDLWTQRIAKLEEVVAAGGGQASELAEARARLTEARAAFGEVLEKDAELKLRHAESTSALRAARSRLDLLLSSAATVMGVPRDRVDTVVDGAPLWQRTGVIDVKATGPGVVESPSVTDGAWVEQGALVLSVIDPSAVRFRAVGLQSDLGRLTPGLPATIVPPQGGSIDMGDSIATELQLGLGADPRQRTIDLLAAPSRTPSWAIPGVSGFLEIAVNRTAQPELAVPLSAVVRDGVTPIIFRRDPANKDKVIRLEADLGLDDGRWIVVQSGLREGDEVVLDGAYQLLLASSGTTQRGGHFHADGTFHADEDH